MKITDLDLNTLAERMGEDATIEEARLMMAILSRECVTDTRDVPNLVWLQWCDEAANEAARRAAIEASISEND